MNFKNKVVNIVMIVLTLFPYVGNVFADTISLPTTGNLELKQLSLNNKEDNKYIYPILNLQIKEKLPHEETYKLDINQKKGVEIISSPTDTTSIFNGKNLEVKVPANFHGEIDLALKINRQDIDTDTLKVFYLSQELSSDILQYRLPSVEKPNSSKPSSNELSSSKPSSNELSSSKPSSNELSSSKPSSNELSSSKYESSKKMSTQGSPHEIRDYFEEGQHFFGKVDITYTDSSGNILEEPIPIDANITMEFEWSLPENVRQKIKAGDYYEFKLPEQVKPKHAQSGEFKGPNGEVYGTYTIDEDGKVKIVFSEEVENHSEISGSLTVDEKFNDLVITHPGGNDITFPEDEDLPPSHVQVKPSDGKEIEKKGEFDRTPNPTSIKWTIDINKGMNKLSNPKVTESFPKGNKFKSVRVYKLVMNLDGSVSSIGQELTEGVDYTVDNQGNVSIIGDTYDAYRLVYETTIDSDVIPNDGGQLPFKNKATLTDDTGEDIDTSASLTAKYGKKIDKKQGNYYPNSQTFDWTIRYNYGQKKIDHNKDIISDTISSNADYINFPPVIHEVTFDKSGNEVIGKELKSPEDFEYSLSPDGKSFTIKFTHDIDQALKIDYKTKINSIVEGQETVTNEANDGGENSTGEIPGNAIQQNVIKKHNNVDYKKQTVDWEVQLNQNEYQMNNMVFTDTFSPVPGLSLLKNESEYKLSLMDTSISPNKELLMRQDFDLELTTNSSGNTGFVIKLKGGYLKTNHKFTLKYTTNFDITILDPKNPNMDKFINGATIKWTDDQGHEHNSHTEDPFKPDYDFANNSSKYGSYNAVTKIITWTIAINLSENQLVNARLEDKLKNNQDYIGGTLKVYEAKTQSDGSVIKLSSQDVNSSMKSIIEPTEPDNEIKIEFPNKVNGENNVKTYLIEFQTSLNDHVVDDQGNYKNIAHYENNGQDREVVGDVSIKNGGVNAIKDGVQDENDPNYVKWNVTINPSLSTLEDVVVTDEPSTNQIIDQNSIKLFKTKVAEDGTINPTEEELIEDTDYSFNLSTDNLTGKQVLEVKFLHQIDTAYSLVYRTRINSSAAGDHDTLTNKVHISGTGKDHSINDEIEHHFDVEIDHSHGNANGKTLILNLFKVDKETQKKLTGAHFQLWDSEKQTILREGDVNKNGELKFGALTYGEYLLVETKAPDGYTIPNELVSGKKLIIDSDTPNLIEDGNKLTLQYNVADNKSNVALAKTDEEGNKLPGARFKVEKFFYGIWEEVILQNNTTDSNGILNIEGLLPGLYKVSEVKAPTGFLINTHAKTFVIKKNSKGQVPTVNVPFINYQGSAELIKTDESKKPLAGAEFKVVNASGESVSSGLVSNESGKVSITHLSPGKYQFIETKAPSGYILNTSPIDFEISPSSSDKPKTIVASEAFINYQGSAELIKTDESKKPLAGAEFKVINASGESVSSGLVSDESGKVSIAHLSPGKYQFIETKAPSGYILNTSPIDFEISSSSSDKPKTIVASEAFINYQGSAELIKTDESKKPLAGAEFKVINASGESLSSGLVSDESGKVSITHLSPGKYQFIETKAPSGYMLNPTPIDFEISSSSSDKPKKIQLSFENKKSPTVPNNKYRDTETSLPSAGEKKSLFTIFIGTFIILISILLYKRAKKR